MKIIKFKANQIERSIEFEDTISEDQILKEIPKLIKSFCLADTTYLEDIKEFWSNLPKSEKK